MLVDHSLHAVTRILLRVCSPALTHAIVTRIGRLLPPRDQPSEIARATTRLQGRGTCLTRALTLAARIPDAEVVIGVQPRRGQRLLAHAWLERRGAAIDPLDVTGSEIVRLSVSRGGARSS